MLVALRVFCLASLALAAAEVGPKGRKKNRKLSVSSAASGEEVASGEGFSFFVERFAVDGTVPSAQTDWKGAPGAHSQIWGYGNHYWPVTQAGKEGVVWWCKSSKAVKVTWLVAKKPKTRTLLQPDTGANWKGEQVPGELTWAASNDEVIIVWIHWPNEQKDHCKDDDCKGDPVCRMMMYKFDAASGSKLQEKDMSNSVRGIGKGTGIQRIYSGALAKYNKRTGKILASFRYLMTRAGDGLNHQGCTTWEIDPTNLGAASIGAYNSHCFDNSITILPNGDAELGSLGDGYCRGIKHIHARKSALLVQLNATRAVLDRSGTEAERDPSGTALTAFTETGVASASQDLLLDPPDDMEVPLGGPLPFDESGETLAPGYEELDTVADSMSEDVVSGSCSCGTGCSYRPIAKLDKKKYQAVFAELAHPTFGKTASGELFSVFGVEETPPDPCQINAKDTFQPYDPRNLVFKTQQGGENGERLLTDFKTADDGSVSRIKLATIEPGRHLLMYEVWKGKGLYKDQWGNNRPNVLYDSTVVRIVDDKGDTVAGPWTPSLPHRVLSHQDELYTINGKLVFYDGSGSEISRYTLTFAEETTVETTDWAAVHKEKDEECKAKGLAAVTEVVPPANSCSASTADGKCKARSTSVTVRTRCSHAAP